MYIPINTVVQLLFQILSMKKPLIISFIFTVLVTVSCTKTVEYPITSDQRKPVIYAFINEDKIDVYLFWSRLVTDSVNGENIDNASISLFESGNFIDNLDNIGNGNYILDGLKTCENHECKIVASIPSYGNVEALTTIPKKIETMFSVYYDENTHEVITNQNFTDPANETNYYYTNIKALIYFNDHVTDTSITLNLNSPMYQNLYYESGSIFHDRMIDGQDFNCRLKMGNYIFKNWDKENDTIYYCDSALIIPQLHYINYDMYQFYTDIYTQDYNNSNAFSESYPVHSNIENGYGIFGAYSGQTDTLVYYPIF